MGKLAALMRVLVTGFVMGGVLRAQAVKGHVRTAGGCRRVVFEGDVVAGQGFEKVFAKGLRFYLEPLQSGWIIRVLDADAPREAHDYAELATPPYRSVSPLLIGTDWSFRAQDAIAWNPRRFRYAGSRKAFQKLGALYGGVVAGDGASSNAAAGLVMAQPEGVLRILDARIQAGVADQAQMAATVAGHLAVTPHTVDQSAEGDALGRIKLGQVKAMRFRVELNLSPGAVAAMGVDVQNIACGTPTS